MRLKRILKVKTFGQPGLGHTFGVPSLSAGIDRFEEKIQDAVAELVGVMLGLRQPLNTDAQAVRAVADRYQEAMFINGIDSESKTITVRRGRPPGSKNAKPTSAKVTKTGRKRRKMSAELRQRIIDAQTKRWARVRRMAKAKANAIASAKAKAKIAKDKAAKDKAKAKTRKPGKAVKSTKATKAKVSAALETSSTSMAA